MLNTCKLLLILTFIVAFNSFIPAQVLPELEKVKEIKLLESTRDDVRKILAEYRLKPSERLDYEDNFETKNAEIEVSYSEGKCVDDDSEGWDVAEWKVIEINIVPKDNIFFKNIVPNASTFKREKLFTNRKEPKVFHRKDKGIIFEVDNGKVEKITLIPAEIYYPIACKSSFATKLISTSSIFNPEIKKREPIIDPTTDIVNFRLSKFKINPKSKPIVYVYTDTNDRYGDTLTYKYEVSAGKIIGQGAKVLWDLSDAKPGTYTITAAVDDGCGFCGKTMTKTIVVKECLDCQKP